MKNIVIFILSIFIFVGCSVKQEIIVKEKDSRIDLKNNDEVKVQKAKEVKKDELLKASSIGLLDIQKLFENENKSYKVAIVYPSRIVGKYAKKSVDTVMGYFLFRNLNVNITTFDSFNIDEDSVRRVFNEMAEKDFDAIIALYPKSAMEIISGINSISTKKIYFPLVLKEEVIEKNNSFIYGAISYKDQVLLLQKLSNDANITFYENSFIGNKLNKIYNENVFSILSTKVIKRNQNNFKRIVKDKKINSSTLMLNTPIIKTSIILSQLRVYDIVPSVILSTQLNYNPLIISLTQFEDRLNFITANSIENVDVKLEDTLSLLDIDIRYNWVNYSILVGINYLYDQNARNIITNSVVNNEVIYTPKFYRATVYGYELLEK